MGAFAGLTEDTVGKSFFLADLFRPPHEKEVTSGKSRATLGLRRGTNGNTRRPS